MALSVEICFHILHKSIAYPACVEQTKDLTGCVSFFCTRHWRPHRGGRRTPQKRFAPGIAAAKTTNGQLPAGLNGRGRRGLDRWLGQPSHPCAPVHERPKGAAEPLLAVALSSAGAQRCLLCSCS